MPTTCPQNKTVKHVSPIALLFLFSSRRNRYTYSIRPHADNEQNRSDNRIQTSIAAVEKARSNHASSGCQARQCSKTVRLSRNCNLPQSNPALSPGRFRLYAFLTAPLSGCMLQSLLFPTHMAVRLSAGFPKIGLTVYFQQKVLSDSPYRRRSISDSDNIASGPYHFHSVHKRILLFSPSFLLYRVENDSCLIPGCSSSGLLSSGWRLQVRTNLKDLSPAGCFGLGADTYDHFFSIFSAGSTQTFIVEQVRIFPPVSGRTEGRE